MLVFSFVSVRCSCASESWTFRKEFVSVIVSRTLPEGISFVCASPTPGIFVITCVCR